jgi:hypothetical protein
MKNSSDTIGNRSHDLPVCTAVPQPLRYRVLHPQNVVTKVCVVYLQHNFVFQLLTGNSNCVPYNEVQKKTRVPNIGSREYETTCSGHCVFYRRQGLEIASANSNKKRS